MVHEIDIIVVIKAILENILGSAILLILYNNSKFLYNGLVQLSTT